MDGHLPPEVVAALRSQGSRKARATGFRVISGDREHAVLKLWRSGFAITADGDPHMRGFVDLMHGETRLARCLILCAEEADGVVTYEFKLRTEDVGAAPVDYARAPDGPVALLGN